MDSSPPSSPYVTQPTQIIERKTPKTDNSGRQESIVQVAASSPIRPPTAQSSPQNLKAPFRSLASSLAPPGTAFRPPVGISRPPARPQVVDLSDDDEGPTYRGGSSDEDSQRGRMVNIKPSTFIQKAQKPFQQPGNGANKFKEITSKAFYEPLATSTLSGSIYDSRNRDESNTSSKFTAPAKRSADVMATAYGGRPAKQARQTGPVKVQQRGPAKAVPVQAITIDDIEDYTLRSKVRQVIDIIPGCAVGAARDALVYKRFSVDDALELLFKTDNNPMQVDLTGSDDELLSSQPLAQFKAPAKQQVKAPNRSIQEKWTSTQAIPRSSQSKITSPPAIPEKPKRRLVQGRKNRSSPITTPPKAPLLKEAAPPAKRAQTPASDDSDSGVGLESEPDTELDGKVLNFFNTCSVSDLADISAITEEVATVVLSQKPFKSLDEVRQISSEPANKATKRRTTKKPVGEKIVDKCLDMWTGYEAVDELVKTCEALGKPVAEEMKKWGVDVYGASKDGELDLVTFDDIKSAHDSGIGTPSSPTPSPEEDTDTDIEKPANSRGTGQSNFFPQPSIMAEGRILKDYQVVGVNWLSLLYDKGLSCILADDMGLGKTCQVVAFLAHLLEKGIKGPHLVVVPGSTIENWLRELQSFCPELSVMPYYADQKERMAWREQIEDNLDTINVIVTTYGMAKRKEDNRFLRHLKPVVCVYDEGHILKNSKSAGYDLLMRIPATFRLLLTGTPLQNNLKELASLLGFILPKVFKDHSEDLESIFSHKAKTTDETHAALLSAQRIARARSMMTPFVLRRKKYQVLKHLPAKTRRVEYCDLSPSQYEIYRKEQERARQVLADRASGKKSNETTNIMMNLRKASIHPLLFREHYSNKILSQMSKACLQEEELSDRDPTLVYEDMEVMTDFELHTFCSHHLHTMTPYLLTHDEWMDSGKVEKLASLLTSFKAAGARTLVFSQFTQVLNILEAVLETLSMRFFRLDGSTRIDERQDMIDQFHNEEDISVFLLSTKAGGAGINLACANKVVIFDSSFNPQEDIQAENRAHRVGQVREVEVVRLVTRGSIEEQIYKLGETKLALDERVAGEGGAAAGGEGAGDDALPLAGAEDDAKKAELRGQQLVEAMMLEEITGADAVPAGEQETVCGTTAAVEEEKVCSGDK